MSAVERPKFYESQILAAADLDAQLGYARDALARHERSQHLWGVIQGLGLSFDESGFTVDPGLLVDGTGRQIVVAAPGASFDNQSFLNAGVAVPDETAWYPVFIAGVDEPQTPSPFRREQCSSQATSRIDEAFTVSVGSPGAELTDPPAVPAVDSSPGGSPGVDSWPVLVGFVQWDAAAKVIKDAKSAPEPGKQPRYSGVYADVVAARGGSVTIRTQSDVQASKPALILQEVDKSLLQVGTLNPNGTINALLTLSSTGDLEVTGKLKGKLLAGAVATETGLVSDGMTIPLPSGVTQAQVDAGKADVSILLMPRFDASDAPTTTDLWASSVLECRVDEARQAHCRTRWYRLSNTAAPNSVIDMPASFSYLISASVKQS